MRYKQYKLNLFFFLIIILQSIFIAYFYFGAKGLQNELDSYAKTTNLLNIERDFEIFKSLKDNNVTLLRKNLDMNLMFHIKPIEKDGLKSYIPLSKSRRLCNNYQKISTEFQKIYLNKYPKTIMKLDELCKQYSK